MIETYEIKNERKNHITVKKLYLNSLKEKSLKKIFRPGNRECPHEKCYFDNQLVIIKVLDIAGSDYHKIEPIHLENSFPVKIINSSVKKLIDLEENDFNFAGPDIYDLKSLRLHLANIYNLEYDLIFSDDYEITITEFEYLPLDKVKII